jgi:hypothetical protein
MKMLFGYNLDELPTEKTPAMQPGSFVGGYTWAIH